MNFQRLEACLKFLSKLQPLGGTIEQMQTELATREKAAERDTLGVAMQKWMGVLDVPTKLSSSAGDLFDPTAHTVFDFQLTESEREWHATELAYLLTERNSLAHSALIGVDWDSPEHCETLASKLELLNDRIATEMELLRNTIEAVRELCKPISDELILNMVTQRSGGQMPNKSVESDT